MDTVNFFDYWEHVNHESDEQKKRITFAKSPKTSPNSVDKDAMSALFEGSGKLPYQTTLTSCNCVDFVRRKLPCKHIYRLAIELGIMDEVATDGINKNTLKKIQLSLPDAIAQLEKLNDDEQRIFQKLMEMEIQQKDETHAILIPDHCLGLLSSPLIEVVNSISVALQAYKRNEMFSILDYAGISGFKRNISHNKLIEWCLEHVANTSELFSSAYALRFSPSFQKAFRKTYSYLLRKHLDCRCYDRFGAEHIYPYGADYSFQYTRDEKGLPVSIISHSFPEDEITDLLNKYGHNRCNNK